jgi:protoporphyrin/coproporphyrin ferrochelatase
VDIVKRGVLVMAYGTPKGLDDVEAYYTDIRHGHPPPPDLLRELTERYRSIGGRSPLLEITRAQAEGIGSRLGIDAYLGQKHAPPFIADAISQMAQDGVDRSAGLVLAPHYSSMSIGDYERRAGDAARDRGWKGRLEMIHSWHLEPGYIDLLVERVHQAVASLPSDLREEATVVFSAHSLPQKIVSAGDPYPEQLRETGEAVARAAGLDRWQTGWQSAGRTSEPWLGPDLLEILGDLAGNGTKAVVVCPCGFVADHLEVLYDVDIEGQQRARELGIALVRTAMPNDDPRFIGMLADVVRRALDSAA